MKQLLTEWIFVEKWVDLGEKIFFKLVKLWRKVTTKLDLVNWRVLSKNPKAFYSLALTFLLKIFGPCGHKTYYCKCSQQVLILPIIILTFELIFIFVILYTNWRTCNFCKSSSCIYCSYMKYNASVSNKLLIRVLKDLLHISISNH